MDLVIRATVIFVVVLVITRAVGRRELSSMEPFDLILLVVIGDLIQQGVTQNDLSVTGTAIVLAVLTLMTVGLAYLNFRVSWLRPVLQGIGRAAPTTPPRRRLAGAEQCHSTTCSKPRLAKLTR